MTSAPRNFLTLKSHLRFNQIFIDFSLTKEDIYKPDMVLNFAIWSKTSCHNNVTNFFYKTLSEISQKISYISHYLAVKVTLCVKQLVAEVSNNLFMICFSNR